MQCQSIKMVWGMNDFFTSESHQVGIKRKDLMKNILTLGCALLFEIVVSRLYNFQYQF
jgi:hypothetical protein